MSWTVIIGGVIFMLACAATSFGIVRLTQRKA